MTATREGIGRLMTRSGRQCDARYLLTSWKEASGARRTEGKLSGADPDVAMESFRPGELATLELGSGETVEVDITGVLPNDEVIFTVRQQHHRT